MIKQVSKYLVPALLTFVFGFLLWQIQRERVSLDYELVESASFPREGGIGQYFIVRLRNSGSKAVEKIRFDIDFPSGSVESTSLSDPKIIADVANDSSSVHVSIPLLNPAEMFSLTVTAIGTPQVQSPRISARAPGVTATVRDDRIFGSDLETVLSLLSLIVGFVAAYSIYTSYRSSRISESISKIENLEQVSDQIKKSESDLSSHFKLLSTELEQETRKREKEWVTQRQEHEKQMKELEQKRQDEERRYDQGEPESVQLIFSIFNRAGLGDRFAELVSGADEVTYWKTGLFLLYWFIEDKARRDSYLKAAELLVAVPKIRPSSIGFVLYFLAKMEQFRGNREGAIRWFEECKKKTPLMYEHLMAQDPAFDLESIENALRVSGNRKVPK